MLSAQSGRPARQKQDPGAGAGSALLEGRQAAEVLGIAFALQETQSLAAGSLHAGIPPGSLGKLGASQACLSADRARVLHALTNKLSCSVTWTRGAARHNGWQLCRVYA